MKARGEKRHTIVDAVLAERSQAFTPNCALLWRNGAKRNKSEEITSGWRSD